MPFRIFEAAQRAPFMKRFLGKDPDLQAPAISWSNGYTQRIANAAGTGDIDVLQLDSSDNLLLNAAAYKGLRNGSTFFLDINGQQGTQSFYISDGYYYLTGIQESHAVAGTDAAAVTGAVFIDRGVGAPGSGASTQTGTFNLKGTANTPQTAVLSAGLAKNTLAAGRMTSNVNYSSILIRPGDRLSFVTSGVLTTLSGVCLTCFFAPWGLSDFFPYYVATNNRIATEAFALINTPGRAITGINYYYKTAGTDAGAVTLDVTQDATTAAPGAGTTMLAAAVSLKATAGTVRAAALTATVANLKLGLGNRLSVKLTGTLTALAGLVVIVNTTALPSVVEYNYFQLNNTDLGVSQSFAGPFDRDYIVVDMSEVHSVVAGGAYKVAVTADAPGVAPGAGAVVQTDNANAGFDLAATANTVQVGTLARRGLRILPAGWRLSVLFAGTKGTTAGVVIGVVLMPQ